MLSDPAVGDRRAHVGDVGGAGEQRLVEQVVDVHPAGREELRVFLAKNPVAENAASHVDPLCVAERSADTRRCDARTPKCYGVGMEVAPCGLTDVGVAAAACAASAASAARTAMIWVIASYGQPVGSVAGASGVVSTEIRCLADATKPTSSRAASLMPSGVCRRLTSAASWALALLEHGELVLLARRDRRAAGTSLHGQHEQRRRSAPQRSRRATSANSNRLPRPLTSCLSLAIGRVKSAKRDAIGLALRRRARGIARDAESHVVRCPSLTAPILAALWPRIGVNARPTAVRGARLRRGTPRPRPAAPRCAAAGCTWRPGRCAPARRS